MKWHLHKIEYPVYNLGPGKRIAVWVQGCDFKCKGCKNENMWDMACGMPTDINTLFNWIQLKSAAFDGITITGGEPFLQYESLIAFLKLIKENTKLNICCYTGFYLHELYNKFPDKVFSKYIDHLVDGRYSGKDYTIKFEREFSNQSHYTFAEGIPYVDTDNNVLSKWSNKAAIEPLIYAGGIPLFKKLRKPKLESLSI